MLHIWKEATVNSATQIGYNLKIYTCMRCGLTYEGGRNKNCSWSYVRTPDNYKIDVAERPVRDCSKCKKCESCQVNKTCYCDYIGVTIELIDDHARKERKTIPARTRGVVAKAVPEGGTPFGGWGPKALR